MASRIEPGAPRRKVDAVQHTLVSLAIIASSTYLASQSILSPEMTLAAWTLAAAVIGTPVVVRRLPHVATEQRAIGDTGS